MQLSSISIGRLTRLPAPDGRTDNLGLLLRTRNMDRLSLWQHLRLLVRMVRRVDEGFPCSGIQYGDETEGHRTRGDSVPAGFASDILPDNEMNDNESDETWSCLPCV